MKIFDILSNTDIMSNNYLPETIPMPAQHLPSPIVLLPALLLLLCGLSGCSPSSSDETSQTSAIQAAIPVRVAAVEQVINEQTLRFAAVARARQRATLTFQVGGVIQSRSVELGQTVASGAVIATLYNPQLAPARDAARSRLEQLRTDSAQAARDLDRIRQLYERAVSPIQDLEQQIARLDSLNAAIKNAEATLQQTEQLLAESILRAPFAGTIEAILLEPGEFAQTGQAVARLSASDGMEIEARAPAHLLDGLETGQILSVISSLTGQRYEGVVLEIGRSSSGNSALYPLVVGLDNNAIRAGDAMEVAIPRRRDPVLTVPLTAIMRSADGLVSFRVINNSVTRVPVLVNQLMGDQAIIADGNLRAGDLVVYAGLTRLADGDRVEVLR